MDDLEVIYDDIRGYHRLDPIPIEADYDQYFEDAKPDMLRQITEDLVWWYRVYDHRLRLLGNYCDWYSRSLLDVGAGYGHFAYRAYEQGWKVSVIEPALAPRALIHESIQAYGDIVDYKGLASAITLIEVLEHLADPLKMLKQCYNRLDRGGVIMILVPHDFNKLQLQVSPENMYWVSPWHINYFQPETLNNLICRAGFRPMHWEATFPMEFFQMLGYKYPGNHDMGRKVHKIRMGIELAMGEEMYARACKWYYEQGIGREILVIGRK